jgi:hypothetical protein
MKKVTRKLALTKETLRNLEGRAFSRVVGGLSEQPHQCFTDPTICGTCGGQTCDTKPTVC